MPLQQNLAIATSASIVGNPPKSMAFTPYSPADLSVTFPEEDLGAFDSLDMVEPVDEGLPPTANFVASFSTVNTSGDDTKIRSRETREEPEEVRRESNIQPPVWQTGNSDNSHELLNGNCSHLEFLEGCDEETKGHQYYSQDTPTIGKLVWKIRIRKRVVIQQ